MMLIETIRSNSYLIYFILGMVFAYLVYKTWNDRHAVGVGNKITEKVKDLLLDYNCKIDSSGNVKCKGEFANLGKYFALNEAVDVIVKNFLRELSVGLNEPAQPPMSQPTPPETFQGTEMPMTRELSRSQMPPPANQREVNNTLTPQSNPSLVGMSGMGGLQPADFQGASLPGGSLSGMAASSGMRGNEGQSNVPFEPIKTRKESANAYPSSKSGSYDPNHF